MNVCEGFGRFNESTIHDPLVEGSRGSAGKSTIHDPLVEGSRGFLKTSTIHEGVTLCRGGVLQNDLHITEVHGVSAPLIIATVRLLEP